MLMLVSLLIIICNSFFFFFRCVYYSPCTYHTVLCTLSPCFEKLLCISFDNIAFFVYVCHAIEIILDYNDNNYSWIVYVITLCM